MVIKPPFSKPVYKLPSSQRRRVTLLNPFEFCEKYKSCVEPETNIYDADTDVSIVSDIGKNFIAPFTLVSPYMLIFEPPPGIEPDTVRLPDITVFPTNVLFPLCVVDPVMFKEPVIVVDCKFISWKNDIALKLPPVALTDANVELFLS